MARVFVFGSNLAGRHGAGSALEAVRNHGAVYGCGVGYQGQSYAIPTKDHQLQILDLNSIRYYVNAFAQFATVNNNLQFEIVDIGCGLAGFRPFQIAPLFYHTRHLPNINFLGQLGPLVRS